MKLDNKFHFGSRAENIPQVMFGFYYLTACMKRNAFHSTPRCFKPIC